MKKMAALLSGALVLCLSLSSCGLGGNGPSGSQEIPSVKGEELGSGLIMGEMSSELDAEPERKVHRAAIPASFRPAVTIGGGVLGEEHYYYRSTLDEQVRKAYDQIRAGLLDGQATIEMSVPLSVEDAFKVYQMVVYDGPELFYATNGCSCSYNNYGVVLSITPGYNELVNDIPGYTRQLQESVAEAVTVMRALGEPLLQVKFAHDYLTHTVDYVSNSAHNQNCYSSLVLKQTVCAGYAHALQYLLQQVNIPCAYVIGYAGEAHAWNILQLYGETYAMDVTWDDPLGNNPDTYYYDYFNITDNKLGADHSRDAISQPLPWANGTACSYQNGFVGNAYGTDFSIISKKGVLPQPSMQPAPDYVQPGYGYQDTPDYYPSEDWNWWEDPDWANSGWDESLWWEDTVSAPDPEGGSLEWWSLLDETWTIENWEDLGDGWWQIWDEESWCYYLWSDYERVFYAVDGENEEEFCLDWDTGMWVPTSY